MFNSDFNICVAAPQSFVRTFPLCPQLNEASYMERSFEQSNFFILSVLLYTLEVTILYSMFYFIWYCGFWFWSWISFFFLCLFCQRWLFLWYWKKKYIKEKHLFNLDCKHILVTHSRDHSFQCKNSVWGKYACGFGVMKQSFSSSVLPQWRGAAYATLSICHSKSEWLQILKWNWAAETFPRHIRL